MVSSHRPAAGGSMPATRETSNWLLFFLASARRDDRLNLARPATTKRYLESLGGSLLSPIKDLPVNYGKYTDYLEPRLADLAVTPQWVAEDLARPELNLLQNDLLDQLILFSIGRTRLDDTFSEIEKPGSQVLRQRTPQNK
jgi:hypothetical protein